MRDARDQVVQVMVTYDERRKIEEEAKKMGLTISAYCRFKLLFEQEEK